MKRTRDLSRDLSKTEFRDLLRLHGFAHIENGNRFIDLRHVKARRHILPVTDDRNRILRQATLTSLLAARAAYEAELALALETERKVLALAERLAPTALPPCRADLDGPAAIAQLADDFIIQLTRHDAVVYADLIRMGWTGEQLKRHVDAARIVASRKQNRQMEAA